ncbi:hypothetical protein [Rhodococcus globerulus]|uniref:Low molecular weight antigen MTB12-like C-terminal domain-containing protein n=1 Tax=Rhodococcus globerulus TaxID=33008 RepID=A0ABU4C3P6_RHOGO|nr:hypothetical protein [Rhodococcus globerulus]MDV6270993.1 hypothetical protein [Rhodococcus globerulus]
MTAGIIATSLMTACSSNLQEPPPPPTRGDTPSSTSTTPEEPGVLPTAEELTALYNTAINNDVPLLEPVKLIQVVEEADPRLAQKFAIKQVSVQFHTVTDLCKGSLLAFYKPIAEGHAQQKNSSIPFTTKVGTWKITQCWVCAQAGPC